MFGPATTATRSGRSDPPGKALGVRRAAQADVDNGTAIPPTFLKISGNPPDEARPGRPKFLPNDEIGESAVKAGERRGRYVGSGVFPRVDLGGMAAPGKDGAFG
jgi:hypothetical protein